MTSRLGVQFASVALLLGIVQSAGARVEDAQALKERLHAAAAASSLDVAGVKPWYLKLDVSLLDENGKLTQQGTIEEWWVAPRLYKVQYDLPGYLVVEIVNGDGHFLTRGAAPVPDMLERLLKQEVHPMPADSVIDHGSPLLAKKSFDKATLDCVMLGHPVKNFPYPEMGLYPTYCFDPGRHALRIAYSYGTESMIRNPSGHFQGRSIATDVVVLDVHRKVAASHVAELRGMRVIPDDFVPPPGLAARSETLPELSPEVVQGMRLTFVEPEYPEVALGRQAEDSVVIHVKIGSDGHVYQPRLVSFVDPDLAIAALSVVRLWTYKPYGVDGAAVDAGTTLTVKFKVGMAGPTTY